MSTVTFTGKFPAHSIALSGKKAIFAAMLTELYCDFPSNN